MAEKEQRYEIVGRNKQMPHGGYVWDEVNNAHVARQYGLPYGFLDELVALANSAVSLKEERDRLRAAVEILPPGRLRVLANWIDVKYPSEINPAVQRDLRKMADAIDAALSGDDKPNKGIQP